MLVALRRKLREQAVAHHKNLMFATSDLQSQSPQSALGFVLLWDARKLMQAFMIQSSE